MLRMVTGSMCGLLLYTGAFAATLSIDSDQLVGASGVKFGASLYDVSFLDGSCAEVADGCDNLSDFAFTTQSGARDASQALLDQVFLAAYDASPQLTLGCGNTEDCYFYTAFGFNDGGATVNYVYARNSSSEQFDEVSASNTFFGTGINQDLSVNDDLRTWAVWTPSPTPVPLPPSAALFLIGLVGLGLAGRRGSAT